MLKSKAGTAEMMLQMTFFQRDIHELVHVTYQLSKYLFSLLSCDPPGENIEIGSKFGGVDFGC